jgi:hypothetical protein
MEEHGKVARSATEMLLREMAKDARSAAGAPWKNCGIPPDVRGARAKAATIPTVWYYEKYLKGIATAK